MIPDVETITRARRYWQSIYPELRPTERVRMKRKLLEAALCAEYGNKQHTLLEFSGYELL